jgi:hypothetical protein
MCGSGIRDDTPTSMRNKQGNLVRQNRCFKWNQVHASEDLHRPLGWLLQCRGREWWIGGGNLGVGWGGTYVWRRRGERTGKLHFPPDRDRKWSADNVVGWAECGALGGNFVERFCTGPFIYWLQNIQTAYPAPSPTLVSPK